MLPIDRLGAMLQKGLAMRARLHARLERRPEAPPANCAWEAPRQRHSLAIAAGVRVPRSADASQDAGAAAWSALHASRAAQDRVSTESVRERLFAAAGQRASGPRSGCEPRQLRATKKSTERSRDVDAAVRCGRSARAAEAAAGAAAAGIIIVHRRCRLRIQRTRARERPAAAPTAIAIGARPKSGAG